MFWNSISHMHSTMVKIYSRTSRSGRWRQLNKWLNQLIFPLDFKGNASICLFLDKSCCYLMPCLIENFIIQRLHCEIHTAQHITGSTDHVRLHFALWQVALWIVADALKCDKVKPFVCILCIHTYWLWRLSKVDTFISKFKNEPNFSNSENAADTVNTCM